MADLHPTQVKLIVAQQAEYDRARKVIEPQLKARGVPADQVQLTVAQNAIRTALEATLESMLPYEQSTLINLAIALASYCVSALPEQSQMPAIAAILENLPRSPPLADRAWHAPLDHMAGVRWGRAAKLCGRRAAGEEGVTALTPHIVVLRAEGDELVAEAEATNLAFRKALVGERDRFWTAEYLLRSTASAKFRAADALQADDDRRNAAMAEGGDQHQSRRKA